MHFKNLIFYLFLLPALALGKLLPDEQNNVDIYQHSSPAVVNITAVTLVRDFFLDIVPQKGVGSGAILKPQGYIVTNYHVVGNAQQVEVTLYDKSTYQARVVGVDPDSDLAVIKIQPKGKKLVALEYGNPDVLAVGQKVLAIGNPFGLGGSLSVGVISSLGRDIRATTDRTIKGVIQTDAAINPGNSGGPLLDSSGKLIGINAQIVSRSGGNEGIGFAISVKTVRRIVDQLIQFGKVLRPEMGINGVGLSAGLFQALNVPISHGVMITEIDPNGPVASVGLKAADQELMMGFRPIPVGGDVIYQLDDTPVASMGDILDYISDKKAGEVVAVHYLRKRTKRVARVTLKIADQSGESGI